ncbi:hypothetical protein GJ699_02295 [Duganella sp. FT80W]|uniref:Sulfatase-modifying factor enzyme domain-containing protein n=1 Tax=Duganella guangzhouensis TaxID=2666084 RepID=A0A6I2KTA0_9BURK|nr:hypothetical protein [Duganella guangzhouensis]MRW88811.1 hypothetical protein [Duganella guangzhouensis]
MNAITATEATAIQATESIFVRVPERTLPGGRIVPSFLVGQYLTSRNDAGELMAVADRAPLVEINYHDAVTASKAAGLALITESQYLSLALDIASVAANWTSGVVGEGKLKQGLRKWSVESALAGTYVSSDADEDRWFTLSNGERICDASGNAFTWIFDDVQGDEQGLVTSAFTADSPSITSAVAPSMTKGAGWQPRVGSDWAGDALLRGGCWDSGDCAGVFRLDLGWPDYAVAYVGLRCTKPE